MGTQVVVLDASAVIGVLDDTDVHHASAVDALEEYQAAELRLPASAYAEVLTRPAQAGKLEEVRGDLAELGLQVDVIDRLAAEAAASLRGRFPSLRLPDALIVGHAEAIDADVVLTTDRRWRRVTSRVRVVG